MLLGFAENMPKATISFVLYLCPSIRSVSMGQLGSHWKEFHEI